MKTIYQSAKEDVEYLIDQEFIKQIDKILMGQPTHDTTEADVVARAHIIKNLQEMTPADRELLMTARSLGGQELEDLKLAELKKFDAERKALLAQEGNRPVVNDPRKDKPLKDVLTEEEVKKQAEETEKWANRFLNAPVKEEPTTQKTVDNFGGDSIILKA